MEHFYPVVVHVDEPEIVELLQQEVARVVEDVAASMVRRAFKEHLERYAVVQILAGMDLVAEVAAGLVEGVEDRLPAPRQLVERGFDQAGRALRPRIDERPDEGARKT